MVNFQVVVKENKFMEKCSRKTAPLVSAAVLAERLPEFFADRFQVLRLAKRRVIPCYVLPGTGRSRSGVFMFCVKEVKKAMLGYYQPVI